MRAEARGAPEESPLDFAEQDAPIDDAHLAEVRAMVDRGGFACTFEAGEGLTAEFPWAAGAWTHALRDPVLRAQFRTEFGRSEEELDQMAGDTSLLQIRRYAHPLYGKGLLATLELPMTPDDAAHARMVNALNAWELSGADLPPLFGAWCIGSRQRPAYASFMPTQYCMQVPGLVINIAIWMMTRQARVRAWLQVSPSRH